MLASESHLTNTSVCHQKSVTVQYIHVHASGIVAVSVSYLCLSIVSRPFISWVTYYMCRYLKFIVLNFSRKCWPHLNFCMPYELFIKCYSKLYCMFLVVFKINQLIINILSITTFSLPETLMQQHAMLLPIAQFKYFIHGLQERNNFNCMDC